MIKTYLNCNFKREYCSEDDIKISESNIPRRFRVQWILSSKTIFDMEEDKIFKFEF